MRTRSVLLFAAALTFAAASATVADGFNLVRKGKVGDEAVYKFSAEMMFGDIKITISGKNREKVAKMTEDGTVTLESVQSDVVVKTPDEEQKMDGEEASVMVYGKDRILQSHKSGDTESDAETYRLALVTTIKTPDKDVKVGDKWTTSFKHSKDGTNPISAEYEVVATEKVGKWDCVKIKFTAKETEGEDKAEATGTVWLDTSEFTTVKEETTIKNAPISMAPTPIDLTIKSERTS